MGFRVWDLNSLKGGGYIGSSLATSLTGPWSEQEHMSLSKSKDSKASWSTRLIYG